MIAVRMETKGTQLIAMATLPYNPNRRLLFAEMTRCFHRPAHSVRADGGRTMLLPRVFCRFRHAEAIPPTA